MEFTLSIGETAVLKKSVFSAGRSLLYAGMPSPYVFSVVMTWKSGNMAMAYNVYFPADTKGFHTDVGYVSVLNVNREYLTFRFEKD